MRIALGLAQPGTGVFVGVSVGVSLGVTVAVGVSVGVLVGLAVGVAVSVGVIVKVGVAGTSVRDGRTVSVGISLRVAVGRISVLESQAETSEVLTIIMDIAQKIKLLRMVDFSLNITAKGRRKLYRKSSKDVWEKLLNIKLSSIKREIQKIHLK
jgi:hypothetical protein